MPLRLNAAVCDSNLCPWAYVCEVQTPMWKRWVWLQATFPLLPRVIMQVSSSNCFKPRFWVSLWENYIFNEKRIGVLIFVADHRKQYLPIQSTLPMFLKPSLSCRIIYSNDPINILDIYSGPECNFWKRIPLLGNSCERGFLIWRVEEGIFVYIFQKYIFISPKCLIMHCIFVTIAYTQHKPDFMSCMWDWPFTPGSHIPVCSAYAV